MKIAVIHDSLIEFGGAERLLSAVLETFPQAHVYTSVADPVFTEVHFKGRRISSANVFGRFFANHSSLFQSISPLVWRSFRLDSYDLVLSVSGHLMSNMVTPRGPVFVQYILTPPKNVFSLDPKTPFQKIFPYEIYLRPIYRKQLKTTPHILTLSHHMQHILYHKLGTQSQVIYPPVYLPNDPIIRFRKTPAAPNYYLVVSRIDRTKAIELAIHACNALKQRLVIVGQSNEDRYYRYLHRIAGPTITFCGFQTDRQIAQHYRHAKAFLFTPKCEDFGIAPIEAMAHGVPVIGYFGGGLRETLAEGKTGIFFHEHSAEALIEALRTFRPEKFRPTALRKRAAAFDVRVFKDNIRQYMESALSGKN